eukprot:854497-Pyramimonas_sp.AAC.1
MPLGASCPQQNCPQGLTALRPGRRSPRVAGGSSALLANASQCQATPSNAKQCKATPRNVDRC